MRTYGYDGSFEGMLTAIFEAYDRREVPDRICVQEGLQIGLMEQYTQIITDEEKATRVQAGIIKKMGQEGFESVYNAWLTPHDDKATVAYQYVRMGMKLGAAVAGRFDDPIVMRMTHMNRQVGFECQRMKGFVRFRAVDGNFYGVFAPDNDILAIIAPHFARRFNDQRWMLQDEKRGKAVLSVDGEWLMVEDPTITTPPPGAEEMHYRALWRAFHETLAIESRRNLKLQRQLLPLKYRKHITEFNGFSPEWENVRVTPAPAGSKFTNLVSYPQRNVEGNNLMKEIALPQGQEEDTKVE